MKQTTIYFRLFILSIPLIVSGSVNAQNETEEKVATQEYVEGSWNEQQIYPETPDTTDQIYEFVDVTAEFQGGFPAFQKHLQDSIVYPKEAIEQQIQGKVYVEFVVFKDGHLGNFRILRSPDGLLSAEALRVVKTLPNMIPAKYNGNIVSSKFRVPIAFRLPE